MTAAAGDRFARFANVSVCDETQSLRWTRAVS
jgi:hypothetical protein